MLKILDEIIHLAYSGKVPRDSPQALLLKRAWESLRRNAEFRSDCDTILSSETAKVQDLKKRHQEKWGVALINWKRSFDEIAGETALIQLDPNNTFDDLYRRLYGDTFYGEDRVVQCAAFNHLYKLLDRKAFHWLSAVARGHVKERPPVGILSDGAPISSQVQLTIDIDKNPIAILYKVQLIIRALREARVQAGKADSISPRIKQQLQTLESNLDADLVGDGRRDFAHDDEVFQIWDLWQERKVDSQIAQQLWPEEYRKVGGRDTATGEKSPIIQRVSNCKTRAKQWIERYAEQIKDENVTVTPL